MLLTEILMRKNKIDQTKISEKDEHIDLEKNS